MLSGVVRCRVNTVSTRPVFSGCAQSLVANLMGCMFPKTDATDSTAILCTDLGGAAPSSGAAGGGTATVCGCLADNEVCMPAESAPAGAVSYGASDVGSTCATAPDVNAPCPATCTLTVIANVTGLSDVPPSSNPECEICEPAPADVGDLAEFCGASIEEITSSAWGSLCGAMD